MATPPSANQGIPMPDDDEHLKDVPDFVRAMGLAIEKQLVMSFASNSDRNTRVPSPVEGMLAWMRDSNTIVAYNGSAWVQIWPWPEPIQVGTTTPTHSAPAGTVYVQY